MTEVEAERAFLDAVTEHGAFALSDHRRANSAFERSTQALAVLRQSPDRGRAFLSLHTQNVNEHVRLAAATYLLPLDESLAINVLESLATRPPFVGINARMTLREWRAGRLQLP